MSDVTIEKLDAGEALAWEDQLFNEVSKHPEKSFLKFWSSPEALVTPKKLAALPAFGETSRALHEDGWPVHVRSTGGDVTPQGPGIVNVTHVYTWKSGGPFDIAAGYERLCRPIAEALGEDATVGWQPGAFCDGAYNVQWNGLKFAGTAMRFRPGRVDKSSHTVLAHALMLFEPPTGEAIAALNRFLSALGEDRVIDAAAHTGLPNIRKADSFLAELSKGFQA